MTGKDFFWASGFVSPDLLWPQHVLGPDPLVELLLVEVAQGDRLLLQGRPVPGRESLDLQRQDLFRLDDLDLLVGSLGNLGGSVIADVRVKGSHLVVVVVMWWWWWRR